MRRVMWKRSVGSAEITRVVNLLYDERGWDLHVQFKPMYMDKFTLECTMYSLMFTTGHFNTGIIAVVN